MWNKAARAGRWFWTLGAGVVLATSLPGCMAHARGEVVYGEPVTVVEAPPRIERYPRYVYHGRPAYLVDDRWYYHDDRDRWVVFRDEPRELRDYRVSRGPAYARRHDDRRYDGDRRSHYQDRRGAELAERRRIEDRRQAQRRDEMRRAERREAERRADRRAAERREEARRAQERRAEEHRANVRRIEERRERERRAERESRVADRKNRDSRKRDRARRDARDAEDSSRERGRSRND